MDCGSAERAHGRIGAGPGQAARAGVGGGISALCWAKGASAREPRSLRRVMEINWPDGLAELGEFLKTQGLSFQRRGIVPHTHDILWQYGNDRIAVRVIADRGVVWSAQVADI